MYYYNDFIIKRFDKNRILEYNFRIGTNILIILVVIFKVFFALEDLFNFVIMPAQKMLNSLNSGSVSSLMGGSQFNDV